QSGLRCCNRLEAARDPKDGVQRRDRAQVVVWRIGTDTLKKGADLPSPFLQVRSEKRHLLVVGKFGGGELLDPAALPQAALITRSEVAYPLRLAARRHDVPLAFVLERIHRRAPPLPPLSAPPTRPACGHAPRALESPQGSRRAASVLQRSG